MSIEFTFPSWENVCMPVTATISVELPDISGVSAMSDGALLDSMRRASDARRVVDATIATIAGEVAARSTRELGYDGLAQRSGAQTPEALVGRIIGANEADARSLVSAGVMLTDTPAWLGEVAGLVADGSISVGAAAAIKKALGTPNENVAADDLLDAAHLLAEQAKSLSPEQVGRCARDLRNELDQAGVRDLEKAQRDQRYLRLSRQADGMTKLFGLLDPESAAVIGGAIDAITSPRRGGPRFVDPDAVVRADAILNDPRSTDQIALDGLVEMVRIAAKVDDGTVFGTQTPTVRIHVKLSDLEGRNLRGIGAGIAWIEGQTSAISIGTAERYACAEGYYPLVFDDNGTALNLGRAHRTYNGKQKIVLAAIWGGCAVQSCDKPVSWTESHHIDEWERHHGETNVSRGILLCRHHHMLLHNNRWQILTRDGQLTIVPPAGDPAAKPMALVSKNPIRRRD